VVQIFSALASVAFHGSPVNSTPYWSIFPTETYISCLWDLTFSVVPDYALFLSLRARWHELCEQSNLDRDYMVRCSLDELTQCARIVSVLLSSERTALYTTRVNVLPFVIGEETSRAKTDAATLL
jgi:hypothetical protein